MCHVLVIEDNLLTAEVIGDLAREAGASSVVLTAAEAEAILSAYDTKPAVILSDVRLAEGSGPRAVRAIVHGLGPIPVIFITGTPDG